jgi:hypothetical protein
LEPCPPYEKNYNSKAERYNRTLENKIRALLNDANLKPFYWGEASKTGIYLLNRTPTKAYGNRTPYEGMHGQPPRIKHLRVFGCRAWAKIHLPSHKLSQRSEECMMLGYNEGQNSYRLLSLDNKGKIVNASSVNFDETLTGISNKNQNRQIDHEINKQPDQIQNQQKDQHQDRQQNQQKDKQKDQQQDQQQILNQQQDQQQNQQQNQQQDQQQVLNQRQDQQQNQQQQDRQQDRQRDQKPDHQLRRSKRQKLGIRKSYHSFQITKDDEQFFEPENFHEATTCKQAQLWAKSMEDEMNSQRHNKTWELTTLPPGCKPIGVKWVYKIKTIDQGKIRYKIRLVAKGFTQKKGIDYNEIYAPVASIETFRLLIRGFSQRYEHRSLGHKNSISLCKYRRNYLHETTKRFQRQKTSRPCSKAKQEHLWFKTSCPTMVH